jgi:hypothetical protein
MTSNNRTLIENLPPILTSVVPSTYLCWHQLRLVDRVHHTVWLFKHYHWLEMSTISQNSSTQFQVDSTNQNERRDVGECCFGLLFANPICQKFPNFLW